MNRHGPITIGELALMLVFVGGLIFVSWLLATPDIEPQAEIRTLTEG